MPSGPEGGKTGPGKFIRRGGGTIHGSACRKRMRKAEPGGPEGRDGGFDPAAIAAVPGKGHFPGGKLDADLVGAAGMQADPDQAQDTFRLLRGFQQGPFAGGFLNSFALFIHHKGFIGTGIMIQKIGEGTGRRFRYAGDHGEVFLEDKILLKELLQGGTGLRGAGEDAGAAGGLVQPVNRQHGKALLRGKHIRQAGRFGQDANRLFTDDQRLILIQNAQRQGQEHLLCRIFYHGGTENKREKKPGMKPLIGSFT